jgi:hypothetical protein
MIKKQSKSLVVDASVARAAGDPPNNPCSEICRDCLVQIRDSKHTAVLDQSYHRNKSPNQV